MQLTTMIMIYFIKPFRTSILFVLLLLGLAGRTQEVQTSAPDSKIDSLISSSSQEIEDLSHILNPYRRDSIAMNSIIKRSKDGNYRLGEAYGENMMGVYLRDISNYREAIKHHKRAISISRSIHHPELEISSLNMIGVVYRRMDAVRTALDYHQSALALAESIPERTIPVLKGISIALNSIGNIYLVLKNYDDAEAYFKKAIGYETDLGSDLGLAINYANLGLAYEERGDFDEALRNYETSLVYNEKIDSDLGRVICKNCIGQVKLKQGRFNEAIALIEPTIETAERLGDSFYISMSYINMGWALYELDKTKKKEAEAYLLKGERVAMASDIKQFLSNAYKHLSILKEREGDFESSLTYQRRSQSVEEEYLNEANQKYVSDLNMKYDSEMTKSKIDLLEKENEIVNIQLGQSRNNLLFTVLLSAFTLGLAYILYRQYVLKNEKMMLKAEQKLMRSQMNPHFIFNALLSIKIYMQQNNTKDAIEYLNQFAKLIRFILASSLEKEVTLQEELETVRLYVNIENIRFCNEIDYEESIDPAIDLSAIRVPSLILQPFVENALWHGLQPKDGLKNLILDVTQVNAHSVLISIKDNGIGRINTINITGEKTNTQKKSIGINLTLQRLQNFTKNFKHTHTLEIIDLYDDGSNPQGTQVLLNLPLA